MAGLTAEKLAQAEALVAAAGVDVWLTFVRETAEGGDPVLPLILEGGLTWQSALMMTGDGRRVGIVGSFDADLLGASGDWPEVVPYVQSMREPLLAALERLATRAKPRIAVNFSRDDVKADGLSHGMFLLLEEYLRGTRFEGCLESAEGIVTALRARKTPAEIERMRGAIRETEELFAELAGFARVGMTEREVYRFVQGRVEERRLGYAWDRAGDPIVNTGPDSAIGHGLPSETLRIAPGHLLHVDLGVVHEGYSSDLQRCWFVPERDGGVVPDEVQRAMAAVTGAIGAGAAALRPGAAGWQVDEAARTFLQAAGYPEYMHAFGHQVGRVAHDGGGILGPRWERYGRTPFLPIEADQVYTLELGVMVPGRGYLGLEEMARVTAGGLEWLSNRQLELPLLAEL
jgi:Xaa-Pro aminopeptidase